MNTPAIPKIIHLTCDSGKVQGVYENCLLQLRQLHPEWSIVIYNDNDARDVIREHMPMLLDVYDAYLFNIQRVDMFRIVAVFIFGGFYLDMDMFCRKPLDSLRSFKLVLGEEKLLSQKENGKLRHRFQQRIANYMFGSVPGHPFWIGFLRAMVSKSQMPVRREKDILDTTGPGLLTDYYQDHKAIYPDITLLPNQDRVCPNKWCGKISCHFGDYGLHLHVGTWRWSKLKRLKAIFSQDPGGGVAIEETIRQLDNLQVSGDNDQRNDVIILGTYDPGSGFFDGLSTVYDRVRTAGQILTDTSGMSGKKVLICGIPFLYEKKISVRNTNCLFTTFESDRLPDFWTYSINKYYHYCFVPHEEVKKTFLNSGVTIPIFVVHQGFTRYRRQWDRASGGQHFSIGFLGVPTRRKNLLKLYRVCRQLRKSAIREIRLAVHVPFFYDWVREGDFEEMRNDRMVTFTVERYDIDRLSEWYNNLSCYIYPSSGEGWSFTPRESLYLGIPTILSDIPVHRELIDSGFCRIINNSGKEPADFNGQYFGEWARIDEQDISNAILDVYGNSARYKDLALRGANWIEDKWINQEVPSLLSNLIRSL